MPALLTLSLAALLLTLIPTDPAGAQNYPWCTAGSYKDGGRNCGFSTFEQCMATVKGAGGYCEQNPMYQPVVATPHRKPRH